MMKIWETVARGEKAQQNILNRLESLQKPLEDEEQSEKNEFLSTKVLKEVSSNNFNSFAQSICESLVRPLRQQPSESFSMDINGLLVEFDPQQIFDFEALIKRIQNQTGRNLSEKGVEKVISILSTKIEQFKKQQQKISESKLQQKSTMKNSVISKANVTEKGNKENLFKIGQGNYHSMSKAKKGQTPNVNGPWGLASKK